MAERAARSRASLPPARPALPGGQRVTGLILAGGRGLRMSTDGQGLDKGLQPLYGRPMAGHVIARLLPQVDALLINANRNLERWRGFGHPVVADRIEGFAGPLAGLHAGLQAAATPWVVAVPCDAPCLPADLVARLAGAISTSGTRLAIARTAERRHPVFMMAERGLLAELERFLAGGGRGVLAWCATLPCAEAAFEDESAFLNLNTPEAVHAFADRTLADRTLAGRASAGRACPPAAPAPAIPPRPEP